MKRLQYSVFFGEWESNGGIKSTSKRRNASREENGEGCTLLKLTSSQMPILWIAIEMHDGTDTNSITVYSV